MHCNVLASFHQHLMAETPKGRVLAQDGVLAARKWKKTPEVIAEIKQLMKYETAGEPIGA